MKLSELCAHIDLALRATLDENYWVEAEIVSLSERGHCYMELAEKGPSGSAQDFAAKVRATCWSATYRRILPAFVSATGTPLRAGLQIRARVAVDFHPVYGLSLSIQELDPTITLGEMVRRRQQTIDQLRADGVFDCQRSLTLPTLVRRIAVISSDTAAGYQDFVHQLLPESTPHYRLEPTLYPAVMQGDNAPESIIAALQSVLSQAEEYDCVVIIRGGGASSDLSCFDHYALCQVAATFPIPILTGIGHTRDTAVLDMVSHLALKTPTAVADFLVDRMARCDERIADLRRRLAQTAQRQILIRRHKLEMLGQRLSACDPARYYRLGYSLLTTTDSMGEQHIVRSVADVRAGEMLTTHLADGDLRSICQ